MTDYKKNIDYAICIASYNGKSFILEQLASIVHQLGENDLIFISDDGSIDETIDLIKGYSEKVKIVGTSRVGGVVKNFERALSEAYRSGAQFIVLADQDDKWMEGRLDSIKKSLLKADVVLTNGYIADKDLNIGKTTIFDQTKAHKGLFKNLIRPTYVGCCMAFKRDVLSLALPFPKGLPWHDWFISMIGEMLFSVKFDDKPSIYYRRHGNNETNTGGKSKNSFLKKLNMRFSILKSMFIVIFRRLLNRKPTLKY